MTVELIPEVGKDEVLDLTKGDSKVTDEQVSTDPIVEDTQGADEDAESNEGGKVATTDSTVSEGDDDSADSDSPSDDDDEAVELFFNGEPVVVTVPDEVETMLKEADVDSKELISALFGKDSDFTLPDEMREKLDAKFGATLVDAYLGLYKGQSEQNIANSAKEAEALKELEAAQHTEYVETVGGEEGLVALEKFIETTFDENQIATYNEVMENGDHNSQMLLLKTIRNLQEQTDIAVNGVKDVKLANDNGSSNEKAGSNLGALSAHEYSVLMQDDKYWDDAEYRKQVDSARRLGIDKGV